MSFWHLFKAKPLEERVNCTITVGLHPDIRINGSSDDLQLDYHDEPYATLDGFAKGAPHRNDTFNLILEQFYGTIILPAIPLDFEIRTHGAVRGRLIHQGSIRARSIDVTIQTPLRLFVYTKLPLISNMKPDEASSYVPIDGSTYDRELHLEAQSIRVYYVPIAAYRTRVTPHLAAPDKTH